jgi:lysophospholipase L1-like esterase
MRERNLYLSLVSFGVALMLFFDRFGARSVAKKSVTKQTMVRQEPAKFSRPYTDHPIKVFCYGDSLTAGTSPPDILEHPYAPFLEKAMQTQARNNSIMVRHKGLPGWTAKQLLADTNSVEGLGTGLRVMSPIQVAILLAGTNDLAYTPDAASIYDSILGLHRVCYEKGVPHTVAIGIPPSGYQSMVPEAAFKAQAVNDALEKYCESEQRAKFMPFPFAFQNGDDKWAPDGLHLTPKGYQILGESLAPLILSLL